MLQRLATWVQAGSREVATTLQQIVVFTVAFFEWGKSTCLSLPGITAAYIFVSCCCFNLLWNCAIENFIA